MHFAIANIIFFTGAKKKIPAKTMPPHSQNNKGKGLASSVGIAL